LLGD
jgi:hypothetical protein